jgi:hypothetical protein
MLAALALLVLSAQALPAAEPPEVDEVVVIGQRLRGWQGRLKSGGGQFVCTTTKSTRDPDIDAIGCASMVTCHHRLAPKLRNMADRKLPRSTRRALRREVSRDLGTCVTAERRRLVDLLREQRRDR